MAVQKPVFMAWYGAEAAGAGPAGWLGVLLHGLWLDATVAGYVTALPLLITLLSFWVRFPERMWRRLLTAYFVAVSVFTAVIFSVDLALYEHWGFRLDATILIYLADPGEAMASVDFWLGVRQTFLAALYAAAMIWGSTAGCCACSTASPAPGIWHFPAACSSCCLRVSIFWRSAVVSELRWPTSRRSISARRCS